ncbi:MAG: glycoside hydrolase family 5 protein [Prevotella sp.]|nr:glycoside hydrolase family 5 protein [Prevotella sp.]
MNRKFTHSLLCLFLTAGLNVQAADFETATEAVKNMGVGWNLGNALEANNQEKSHDPSEDAYWGQQGLESQTCWGQATTKPELLKMMKEAGFGAIRVPVTWYNHMDKDGKVNAEWMARVHEVVDYVINNGMYCIINVHHDTGAGSSTWDSWLKADEDIYAANKARYEYLWQQIAEEFKDYDHHLLFESYNEMLDKLNSWNFASSNAEGQYDAAVAASAYSAINKYAQSFVNVVRASGGNNAQRNLIVNTYGASNGGGNWNSHLLDPLKEMKVPTGESNHIAFEVHAYPYIADGFESAKSNLDETFNAVKTYFINKGYPVIIGEWGSSNVDKGEGATDYDVRKDEMFKFVDYWVQQAKNLNIATFYWMGLSDGLYRGIPSFNQADLAERIVKAYHGSDFSGVYPVIKIGDLDSFTAWEGAQQIDWSSGSVSIPASIFKEYDATIYMELTYTQNYAGMGVDGDGNSLEYDDIQFRTGNWADLVPITTVIDGTEKGYSGDIAPSEIYGTPSGTQHTTTLRLYNSPNKKLQLSQYGKLKDKGLVIFGHGVMIQKVAFVKTPTVTGIQNTVVTKGDGAIYNLQGQRVKNPTKGIFIQDGKKFIVK